MAPSTSLRSRRSAAQLHALVEVERDIRSNDRSNRRQYLREFARSFRSYECLMDAEQLQAMVREADTILIGDYHALPASQRFAATMVELRAQPGDRPVVLGVETIFARDQHIIEEWWRREIEESELRQRIRFDLDWGYDWAPFYELLVTAREHGEAIYGLDCMPRENLRKIGARDRHAAHKLAEIRALHPRAVIVVLFGESHLAQRHLPRQLHRQLPTERLLTVLQNIDALYWHAAGERQERVEAVRVSARVTCVFNSTPLEKYESYRLHLSRWGRTEAEGPDLTPTIYNLIDSLLCFLGINRYSSHNGSQPKFLVDLLPEVYGRATVAGLRRVLSRYADEEKKIDAMLQRVEERGSVYLPAANAFYVSDFQMAYAAEEAARFLHHACRGLPLLRRSRQRIALTPVDRFHARAYEHALAYFGSRLLCPARPVANDQNECFGGTTIYEKLAQDALRHREQFDSMARTFGYQLGGELYSRYLKGAVSQRNLRSLFLTHIDEPDMARRSCRALISKLYIGEKNKLRTT